MVTKNQANSDSSESENFQLDEFEEKLKADKLEQIVPEKKSKEEIEEEKKLMKQLKKRNNSKINKLWTEASLNLFPKDFES